MEILASCSYGESLSFDGKLISEDLEDSNDRVLLNVVIKEEDLLSNNIGKFTGNTKCVTFMCDVDYSRYSFPKERVFREYIYNSDNGISLTDYVDSLSLRDDIINLIRLPNSYSNMRDIRDICSKYENLRVIGGELLGIDGVRIGRFESSNGSILYNGIYDQFLELPLSEIRNLKEVIKKSRKKLEGEKIKGSMKNVKEKKNMSKKVDIVKSFSTLFSGVDEEDF